MDGSADRVRDRRASIRLRSALPTRFSRRSCPRVPPQTMFGPETPGLPRKEWIPKSFETARPFKIVDSFSPCLRFVPDQLEATARVISVVAILPVLLSDHADHATLGRQRRPRRPGLKDGRRRDAEDRLNRKASCRRDASHHRWASSLLRVRFVGLRRDNPSTGTYLKGRLEARPYNHRSRSWGRHLACSSTTLIARRWAAEGDPEGRTRQNPASASVAGTKRKKAAPWGRP